MYALEISKLTCVDEHSNDHILLQYQDLRGAFNEEASNELPDHGPTDIKIDFKEGE